MSTKTLQQLTKLIMLQAQEKGWGTTQKDISIPEKMALIHSEVSEAYEAYRQKKSEEFSEELGDIIFRILHLAGCLKINLEKEILQKLEKNKTREWKGKNENNSCNNRCT